ncbi:hypothetical protein LEP1GSC151_1471 [Leptospira interrogans serovar Grippotyphosa str. LT2186]|uniref:Uncharacterized protein n=4 Tax=Leptospira interrogans TaxID=173 RepID=M6ZXN3_LEPIR|nr:hypothetical protein LEP1GSC045_4219 [Leptospira interrogans serovar Pomona str. Kennewicki LC82-25]EKN99014.1 hypothetical protein LEP1GSC014_1379 [Leptospira interrogans serovar Pomona str. Pomona]EKO07510.1 hypothetical protein LEP1GSC077_3212 [Leptospira interrogans str. C10069]EKO25887.1 hypothetical protein LEP1GSC104_1757 [Leptospira interrogans str. UI 12621]EKR45303.1 hypothetical protein LEP1GSC097_3140 [Leptospira interrogans serovar Grippotyphosa str. UI 08368]EKR81212.1 hypothe
MAKPIRVSDEHNKKTKIASLRIYPKIPLQKLQQIASNKAYTFLKMQNIPIL